MANPFDNENFAIVDYSLPVAEGQSTLFLGTFMIQDNSICDDLVAVFDSDPSAHRAGVVGRGQIKKESKDSMDSSTSLELRRTFRAFSTSCWGIPCSCPLLRKALCEARQLREALQRVGGSAPLICPSLQDRTAEA